MFTAGGDCMLYLLSKCENLSVISKSFAIMLTSEGYNGALDAQDAGGTY